MTARVVAGALVAMMLAVMLAAQRPPELGKLAADSDVAFKAWRDRDPKLEAEVRSTPRAALDGRIQKIAEDAQKMTLARHELADGAFLAAKDALDTLDKELAMPVVDVQITALKAHEAQLASDAALLDKNIQVFLVDKDPLIQKVKAEMDKERVTLRALRDSLVEEQKTLAAVKAVGDRGESARAPAVARVAELMALARQDRERLERESALWQAYYRALPGAGAPEVSRAPIAPAAGPAVVRPSASGAVPATAGSKPAVFADGSRWAGAWTFPPVNRMFSGEEPELLDITVREFNGQLTGTLFARFKFAKTGQRDPVLRLDFSGPLTAARSQKLSALTSDGIKGVVELLPGSAANLIEVTWQLEANPTPRAAAKVRSGDAVLWKK